MEKEIKIWHDKEGDCHEVIFDRKAGYFKETANDSVMKKVGVAGNIIGFFILNVSMLKGQKPLSVGIAGYIA
ncbi:MAG: DUF2283 domain-containing protein [Euryarchaeota archaeon]|nr:DUF2283 domain-containing protein [Euryarchaeota archaeon]